ncbi:MAG TPA: efflux RND transporter periplasmic adaptor subunit [Gemmataceae bacterium]|jgi:RND family efflux transporter MFP subunit|nr:efflux RND transporter periplasmic adaptor subunit [Gemmataceae bacterium]
MRFVLIVMIGVSPALAAPREVIVLKPIEREVFDSEIVIGRTAASVTVDVRARVTGYLDKVLFKEGTAVKKGEALFQIDDRLQRAELAKAQADLNRSEASLKRVETDHTRLIKLLPQKVVSQEELERSAVAVDEAKAQLQAVRAVVEIAKVNLAYTHIASPIDGRIGRTLIDAGNLVRETDKLVTIVVVEPLHVEFDVDERTADQLSRYMRTRKDNRLAVECAIGDDVSAIRYRQKATIDFVDPAIDAKTGTLRIRAVLPNPKDDMRPGQFVSVRVRLSDSHQALLLPTDYARNVKGDYVLVVNDKNVLEERPIKVGNRYDHMWEVESGLKPNDRVLDLNNSTRDLKAGDEVRVKPASETKE